MGFINTVLGHPLTRGMDLDDPNTTELRKEIILSKPFLCKVYRQWYSLIAENLPAEDGPVLELGSGAGFLKEHVPSLITSDIMPVRGCDLACSALQLPFADNSLRAVVMMNVLHHIADPGHFFQEASRCIRNEGRMIMIEPWVSRWSRFVFSRFHHEPFDPGAASWILPESGPLSGGNDALPWIIFSRDIEMFRKLHSNWLISKVRLCCPLSYLLSGGVSMRSILPGWMFEPLSLFENHLPDSILQKTAMFSLIVMSKQALQN